MLHKVAHKLGTMIQWYSQSRECRWDVYWGASALLVTIILNGYTFNKTKVSQDFSRSREPFQRTTSDQQQLYDTTLIAEETLKKPFLIARFMGPTWGPSGADRTQVGPMLAPWTLLSGMSNYIVTIIINKVGIMATLGFQWLLCSHILDISVWYMSCRNTLVCQADR